MSEKLGGDLTVSASPANTELTEMSRYKLAS